MEVTVGRAINELRLAREEQLRVERLDDKFVRLPLELRAKTELLAAVDVLIAVAQSERRTA